MKGTPCIMKCADGSPCGRRVKNVPPGELAICHLHKATLNGNPHNGGRTVPPKQPSRLEKAREFQRNADPRISIKGFEMEDAILAQQQTEDHVARACDVFMWRASLKQYDRLRSLLSEVRALQATVAAQPPRQTNVMDEVLARDQQEREAQQRVVPPPAPPPAPVVIDIPEEEDEIL